jgi:hypothetical protein
MSPYRIFVRMEAAEVLRSIRGIQRASLVAFIGSLTTEPDTRGDYSERDETGRDLEIKVVGSFAVTYWTDHAATEVKVVDVRRADRA